MEVRVLRVGTTSLKETTCEKLLNCGHATGSMSRYRDGRPDKGRMASTRPEAFWAGLTSAISSSDAAVVVRLGHISIGGDPGRRSCKFVLVSLWFEDDNVVFPVDYCLCPGNISIIERCCIVMVR